MPGRPVIELEAFESGSALVEVIKAEDYVGESRDGTHFEKLNYDVRVISYVEQEDDDGEWIGAEFSDGAYYKENRAGEFGIPVRGKLPELIVAIKDEDYFAGIKSGRIEFDPQDLVRGRFRAAVQMSDRGYSNVVWNTIAPAKKKGASKKAKQEQKEAEDQMEQNLKEAEERAELSKDENNPHFDEEEKTS